MVKQKLILVLSTVDKSHNFLGLFDEAKKIWLKNKEFKADIAEEFFLIFKKELPLSFLDNLEKIIVNQADGSFSGLRLSCAVANSLKIAFPSLKLFSTKAQNATVLKSNVEKRIGLKEEKEFIFPRYSGPASINC
jgi:hypothetical protein